MVSTPVSRHEVSTVVSTKKQIELVTDDRLVGMVRGVIKGLKSATQNHLGVYLGVCG